MGAIDVRRRHGYCRGCGQPGFAADDLLGLGGWMTPRARGMACLAGVNDPFRKADALLADLCGWRVCAETVRRCCHQEAAKARRQREHLTGLPERFDEQIHQRGQDVEAHLDAGKVNTPEGWRDVKVAVFACRGRGESSTVADYEQRDLPAPSVRGVVAEVEEARAFGQRCQQEATRLGISVGLTGLSVLGDGAEWIWNLVDERFTGAVGVLDVYHGVEKLAEAAREAFGAGTVPMQRWLEQARAKLVGDGYSGVCEQLARPLADEAEQKRLHEKAPEVLNYFCGHQGRLGYAARLRRGQAIGSGLVEGTIKQRVNVRMKRGSARWLAGHVGPFVELMALADTPEWAEYWALMAL